MATVGVHLALVAMAVFATMGVVWRRSRAVALGIVAGLAVLTFDMLARQATRAVGAWEYLQAIPWWVLTVVVLVCPWIVASLVALLLHRRGHPGASAVALAGGTVLYAAWLWVWVVYPFYDLTGTCLPPAKHVVAVGGDGRAEWCDLPPG